MYPILGRTVAGLLKFLRVYDVGSNHSSFQKLLKSELADVLTTLVSRIGIRTVKSQIEGELSLPPQERFIVPVNFTPIELYNYRAKYGEALAELRVQMDASQLTGTWTMSRALMASSLVSVLIHTADNTCTYSLAGYIRCVKPVSMLRLRHQRGRTTAGSKKKS